MESKNSTMIATLNSRQQGLAHATVPIMLLALAGTPQAARADEPETPPVNDESLSGFMNGPQDLPGIEKGARTRKPVEKPEQPTPAEAKPGETPETKPDWFGGKPWWEWSNATGDWGGVRTKMENAGFTLSASLTLDWSSVWSGGINNTAHSRTLWDVNLSVDLEKLVGLNGATVFADFQSIDGRGSAATDVGSFQLYSNIESATDRDQVSELWYEQKLFHDVLRVKAGKIDVNKEFDFTDAVANFMNGTAATSPTIVGLPVYPDPSIGVAVFVYPLEQLYIGGGVFDGATVDGISTGDHSPKTFFSDDRSSAWFWIGEVGVTWEDFASMGAGRVAAGGWQHTADFTRFDGNPESSTEGFYALGEQQVWKRGAEGDDAERGLFAFAQFGITDGDVAAAQTAFDAGVALKGTCAARPDDGAGFMLSWVDLSDADTAPGGPAAFVDDETLFELYYKLQVTPFVSVQPDLQFFINPGGTGTTSDAWVGSIRLVVSF